MPSSRSASPTSRSSDACAPATRCRRSRSGHPAGARVQARARAAARRAGAGDAAPRAGAARGRRRARRRARRCRRRRRCACSSPAIRRPPASASRTRSRPSSATSCERCTARSARRIEWALRARTGLTTRGVHDLLVGARAVRRRRRRRHHRRQRRHRPGADAARRARPRRARRLAARPGGRAPRRLRAAAADAPLPAPARAAAPRHGRRRAPPRRRAGALGGDAQRRLARRLRLELDAAGMASDGFHPGEPVYRACGEALAAHVARLPCDEPSSLEHRNASATHDALHHRCLARHRPATPARSAPQRDARQAIAIDARPIHDGAMRGCGGHRPAADRHPASRRARVRHRAIARCADDSRDEQRECRRHRHPQHRQPIERLTRRRVTARHSDRMLRRRGRASSRPQAALRDPHVLRISRAPMRAALARADLRPTRCEYGTGDARSAYADARTSLTSRSGVRRSCGSRGRRRRTRPPASGAGRSIARSAP